jgi:serine/threonine protein kinase
MVLEGQQIDRYHIVRLIGRGGMGKVYLARDPDIGQQVAIKVIRMEVDFSPEARQDILRLFKREAKAIVALNHPHILSLHDYGEQLIDNEKILYLVMPYLPEGTLDKWWKERSQAGLLDPQDVVHMIWQAAEALQHAHDHKIIHQDVKPSNFLLRERKESPSRPDLLLTDFGVARLNTGTTSKTSQAVRGTPAYMAPEQWEGRPVVETDQYALGIMAYELLTRHLPFRGKTLPLMMNQHCNEQPVPPSQVNSCLPQSVDAVLLRALSKQSQDRFPSILDFAKALQRAFDVPTGDVEESLEITPEEAERGTSHTVTLLTGHTLTVVIPPKVQDGHRIVLAGMGERQPESGLRGNVVITVIVQQANISPPIQQAEPVKRSDSGGEGQTSSKKTGVLVSRRQRLLRIVLAGAISLLFLLSTVVGVEAYQGNVRLNTLRVAPTLTASAHQRAANLAATATARAEAYPSYLPGQGKPALFDPLRQPGFWVNDGDEVEGCQFIKNTYHSREMKLKRFYSCIGAFSFSNFAVEVEMTIIQGDCGGVLFRSSSNDYKFYRFEICRDGQFDLLKYVDNDGQNAQELVSTRDHAAIKRGANETNVIAVVARGNQITLFINKQQVAIVQDGSYTAGSIELMADAITDPTEVSFQNVKIWTF